jgi:hypothetical protein
LPHRTMVYKQSIAGMMNVQKGCRCHVSNSLLLQQETVLLASRFVV